MKILIVFNRNREVLTMSLKAHHRSRSALMDIDTICRMTLLREHTLAWT